MVRHRRTTALHVATSSLGALALLLFAGLALGPHVFGYRTMTMLSGSMSPAADPGDLLVLRPESPAAVTAGQIVTFTAPTPDHPVVSHRVVQVVTRGGSVAVRTRGDANSADDPWEIALDQSTVWHTVAVVPAVGGAISFLHNNGIRVFAVWVLPALLCADILWRLWRRPRLEVPAA